MTTIKSTTVLMEGRKVLFIKGDKNTVRNILRSSTSSYPWAPVTVVWKEVTTSATGHKSFKLVEEPMDINVNWVQIVGEEVSLADNEEDNPGTPQIEPPAGTVLGELEVMV